MIILTRAAIGAIETAIQENKKPGYGVRVAAEPGGCSGPKYSMRLEKDPMDGDVILEIRDVRVFVDEASMNILGGATMDFSDDADNYGFSFELQQEAQSCSSGEGAHSCNCRGSGFAQ